MGGVDPHRTEFIDGEEFFVLADPFLFEQDRSLRGAFGDDRGNNQQPTQQDDGHQRTEDIAEPFERKVYLLARSKLIWGFVVFHKQTVAIVHKCDYRVN